jgi:hypothetical protein
MKKTPRRLALTKETVRVMSDISMRAVRGAAPTDTIQTDTDASCETSNCTEGCPETNFCTFKTA